MKFDTNKITILALCFLGLIMLGCPAPTQTQQNQTQNASASIANPASVYCVHNGGISKIVTAADGSQSGLCILPNNTQCDEWAYYRGDCPKANKTAANLTRISSLNESDFDVVDDSMPNLMTNQGVVEGPNTTQ